MTEPVEYVARYGMEIVSGEVRNLIQLVKEIKTAAIFPMYSEAGLKGGLQDIIQASLDSKIDLEENSAISADRAGPVGLVSSIQHML